MGRGWGALWAEECWRAAVSLLQVSILLELGVKLAQEVVQLGLIRVNSRRELADLLVHLPHLILCEWRLLVFRIRPRNVLDLPLARLVERGGRAGSGPAHGRLLECGLGPHLWVIKSRNEEPLFSAATLALAKLVGRYDEGR